VRRLLALALALAAAVAATVLAACAPHDGKDDGRLDVVAAFYPLAEAARQVGGDLVDVNDLTPPGVEPHDFEVTPKQVDALQTADLAIVMGRDFQPSVEAVTDVRRGDTLVVLDALHVQQAKGSQFDPHVWLDPVLMQRVVAAVEQRLARVDPTHAAAYRHNAQRYRAELAAVDRDYATGLAHCGRDEIVTSHAAFGYLARRYHLQQRAIEGLSPDQEPAADRIAELADLARRHHVTTIFTEPLASPKVAQTLARESGGLRTAVLNPLEGLTDAERNAGDDYVSVMAHNLASLRRALACR
jgi:zinc transport system substrate-binding protein